jgi:peptidoglycan hydrolase-like protein with peptidoglycan-binding domain/GH25 family lysozyme M1 (1,4-beta-N-acetylmuramidase)
VTLHLIDVSHYDYDRRGGNLDWATIRGAGIAAVCVRATYGDPAIYNPATRHFRAMATGARAAGFELVGGYHNLIRGDAASMARQVAYFRGELAAAGCTWAMLDVEPYEALKTNGLWPRWADVLAFTDAWHEAADAGPPLAFYIARWVWDTWLGRPDMSALPGPLVSARYVVNEPGPYAEIYARAGGDLSPAWAPYGGVTPAIWQYTSKAMVPGASTVTDVNAFRGTYPELATLLTGNGGVPMAPNPNPSRVTDASWWFVEQFLAMHRDLALSGVYANKKGFHNTYNANVASWPGNYSTQGVRNQRGPRDKARGYDITSRSAQAGNYTVIAQFSGRLHRAGQANDPRVLGWYEYYGQIDNDLTVEGRNFQAGRDASSDPSHLWHIHLSELTEMVADYINKLGLLSVLAGEALASFRDRMMTNWPGFGGVTLQLDTWGAPVYLAQVRLGIEADGKFGPGTQAAVRSFQQRNGLPVDGTVGPAVWAKLGGAGHDTQGGDDVPGWDEVLAHPEYQSTAAKWLLWGSNVASWKTLAALEAYAAEDRARDAALRAVVETLAQAVSTGGGNLDTAAVLARIDAHAEEAKASTVQAVESVLERLRINVEGIAPG